MFLLGRFIVFFIRNGLEPVDGSSLTHVWIDSYVGELARRACTMPVCHLGRNSNRIPFSGHSKELIIANLELLLKYCSRFYDRQFMTRGHVNHGLIEQFEQKLNEYLLGEKLRTDGVPTVAYFAQELHLSPNYFGDLIKKETGKSALEYIQLHLIDLAKERIFDTSKSVGEIAYELGFKYPQHFTRFFKQKVGVSPVECRSLN